MTLEFEIMTDLSPRKEAGTSALAYSKSSELSDFLGPCTVIAMNSGAGDISASEIQSAVGAIDTELKAFNQKYGGDQFVQSRLLFKTKVDDGTQGRLFSQEALKTLSDLSVKLVGTDMETLCGSHSTEPSFSIIVNLCLDYIEPGYHYQLLAPPLLMEDINPVPVRPILLS
jgi:kynurenine formamidase